jgi:hypothetical protein
VVRGWAVCIWMLLDFGWPIAMSFSHDAFARLERTHKNFTSTASCSWNAKPPGSCLVGDRAGNNRKVR